MASTQLFSTDLKLSPFPQVDVKKNPDIANDLTSVHQAIRLLQAYVDSYTGARLTAAVTETIVAGHMVNIYGVGTVLSARNADAATPRVCIAFALGNYAAGQEGEFQTQGINDLASGLTVGTTYYLGAAPGSITNVAPGNKQTIGIALSDTVLLFRPTLNFGV